METARPVVARLSFVRWGYRNEKDIEGGTGSCADVAATRGDGNRQFIVIVDVLRIIVQ